MNVSATITTETEYSDLRRVIDDLTEHEGEIERIATPSPTGADVFHVHMAESEALLEFHRLCIEQGIQFDIRQIGHDLESMADSAPSESAEADY